MEVFPTLELGWLNGWLFLLALVLTDGVLFLIFPNKVVKQLFDRSGWTKAQIFFTVAGKVCALACVVLLFMTPLKFDRPVFWVGIVVGALGLVGLARALIDFRGAPAGEPATTGMYRLSRHPQIVMSSVVILGASVAIGSWAALWLLAAARVLGHFGILAEEEVCQAQYGAPYEAYLAQVPRYFVLF